MDVNNFKPRIQEILRASDLTVVSTKQIRQQLESEYNMSLKPFKKQLDALVMDTLEEVMSDKNNNGAKDDTDTDADANQSATMEDLFGEDQVSFPDDGNGTTTTVSDQDLAPAVSNSQNVPNYAQSLGLALPPTSFATQTLHTPSLAKATTSTTNTKRPKKSKDVISSSDSDLSSTEDLVPRSKKLRTDGAAAAGGKARKKGPDTDAEMARKLHSEVNGLRRARGDAKGAIILKKKKRATAAEAEDKADKPKRNTGLSKPMQLSPALGELLGAAELSRPEVVKRMWVYIKEHNLQDPADKRWIICDERLTQLFGKDRVNSFGMNKDLTQHLWKKDEVAT